MSVYTTATSAVETATELNAAFDKARFELREAFEDASRDIKAAFDEANKVYNLAIRKALDKLSEMEGLMVCDYCGEYAREIVHCQEEDEFGTSEGEYCSSCQPGGQYSATIARRRALENR